MSIVVQTYWVLGVYFRIRDEVSRSQSPNDGHQHHKEQDIHQCTTVVFENSDPMMKRHNQHLMKVVIVYGVVDWYGSQICVWQFLPVLVIFLGRSSAIFVS